jgi:Flp pilus assembly secretin CpaC
MSRRLKTLFAASLMAFGQAAPAAALAQSPFPRQNLPTSSLAGGLRGSASVPAQVPLAPVQPAAYDTGAQTVRVGLGGQGADRQLSLPRGKSAVIDLPVDARDVLVSNPKVADVVLSTPRRIYVMGVGAGQTDAVFFDASGRQLLSLNIRVDQDVSALGQTLNRILPGSNIRIEGLGDNLVLTGEVRSASEADKAVRLAQGLVARPEQIINMLGVAGSEQVMLKVRVVEVQRSVIKQLGFNLNAITGQLGMPQYTFANQPTFGVNGAFLGGATGGYALNTTSQPVSGFPLNSTIDGLSQAAGLLQGATSVGIPLAQIGQYVASFLTGTGVSLTPAQQAYASSYVSGILGTTSTQITPNVLVNGVPTAGAPYTATANLVGINSNNIGQYVQAYVNGGTVGGQALTNEQRLWLNEFTNKLNTSYNAAAQYSMEAAQDSTFRDRSNPANYVATNRAGSTGLNQAEAMIQAFERVGLIRTLAEPNLTAISGESAKFLAGGEFPVPVAVDATGRITAEFKQFGVGLGFTPVVLSSGRISLKISTEVSELTSIGSFTLQGGNAQSLSLPGLNVRRAETMVELPSGGGMMIAGLLQSKAKQTLDSLPGVTQLPVLGALFRSRDFLNEETELVVIVTPYLVKPVSPDKLQTPADGLVIASDLQTTLLGRLNQGFGKAKPAAPTDQTYQGPFGYVVD